MSIAKQFSNNQLKGLSLRANEATSPSGECSPSEILKVQLFAPYDDTVPSPRALKFHFETSYEAKTVGLFMNV